MFVWVTFLKFPGGVSNIIRRRLPKYSSEPLGFAQIWLGVYGVRLGGDFLDVRVPNNIFNSFQKTDRCDCHVTEHD